METLDLNDYLPIFIEESKENVQQISNNLLRLEEDAGDTEAINEIFRAVHTVKGMSATMGYSEISLLAHRAENQLDEIRQGLVTITPAMITGFFHIIDEFEAQLHSLEVTGNPRKIGDERFEEMTSFLLSSQERREGEAKSPDSLQVDSYLLEIFFSKDCLIPQARAMIVCNQLSSVGTLIRTSPDQDKLPDMSQLEKLRCWIKDIRPEQVRALLEGGVEIDYYTIEKVGSPEVEGNSEPNDSVAIQEEESANNLRPEQVQRHTVRVDTERMDQLLNLVSELVINKTALQQAATVDPLLTEGVEHLHRLTSELQSIVMKMRMIPLETVFNRFPRMIRDTAITLDKMVNLEIHGGETELDRTIIDDIADPLVHLLRNAIDHGIEPMETRLQKGKPRIGTVRLEAYQTGNQVIIEVSDDGRGLDLEQIRTKARELHLLTGPETEAKDLASLIFTPGLSTASSVTDLSGRGVGLDVVKNSIEALGGSIDVLSTPDVNTTFIISLPLTLAIIQGLLVECGQEIYVVPLSYVKETGIFYREEIRTIGQQEIIMLRGKVLPIIFLDQLLGAESTAKEELNLVVVRYGDRQLGIAVDDLLTQQDIVIKNVNWGEQYFRSFLGCSILGDGSVVMILDVNVLLSVAKVRGINHA